MAIRKIEMRPPGSGDYADVLYPKTSADIVMSTDGTVQGDINNLKTGKSDTGHTHTKANITDFSHTHTKADVTDFSHTHTKANITDFSHTHTKSEISDFPALGTAASKNTGTTSGTIPVLDANGKLSNAVLPALAITDTYVIANQTDMLALVAQAGDVAVRTDLSKSFILKVEPASTLENWQELLTPTDIVTSVAGKTGAVTLSKSDVGLGNVTNESKATMFTSPAFTGTPTAPTAATGTNTTQIATTAFVKAQNYLTGITKADVEAVLTGTISSHTHASGTPIAHATTHLSNGTDAIAAATTSVGGLMSAADKTKLDGIATNANKYTHPTGDGNLHVPATSTTNNGKILKAGASAGSLAWGTLTASDVGAAASNHTHTKSSITDFPTAISAFSNDIGYITKSVTIGATQPSDGTMWYKEI